MSDVFYPLIKPEQLPLHLAAAAMADRSLFLHGGAGIGKSTLIALAARDPKVKRIAWSKWSIATGNPIPEPLPDLEVVHLTIPQHEAEDFTGVPRHMRQGEGDWVTAWTPVEVFRRPHPVVLFLDEVSAAETRVQKVLLQLVQEHRIANVFLTPGTVVVLAGNRVEDRAHLKSVPFPLGNRCAHYLMEPSAEAWIAWSRKEDLPGVFIAWVAQQREAALFAYNPEDPSLAQLTPRSLEGAARGYAAGMEMGMGPEDLEDVVLANLGQAQGTKLNAYLRLRHELPTWSEIVSNPAGAKLPARGAIDRNYYICGMVMEHLCCEDVPEVEIGAAMAYMGRFAQEATEGIDALAWMLLEVMKTAPPASPRGKAILGSVGSHPTLAQKVMPFVKTFRLV